MEVWFDIRFVKRKNWCKSVFSFLFFCGFLFSSCNFNDEVRLNDVQVIGSHNSYKQAIEKELWNHLFQINPSKANGLQYDHISIQEQLKLGLRSIELDIFYDPEGGQFVNPKGLEIVKQLGGTPKEFDVENKLNEPGFKMLHIQDIDFRSHNLLFKECLVNLKKWSKSTPNHNPIVILINAKDKVIDSLTKPLPFSEKAFQDFTAELLAVFNKDEIITPADVKGDFETLEKAVLSKGWPTLNECKGKFIFVLDEKPEKTQKYLDGHEFSDQLLFVNAEEGNSEAAFRIVNDPIKNFEYIKTLVEKGYLVRTRADAGTKEARGNDYTKFEKAKESGAQVISTDYYIPTTLFPSTFKVSFENNTYKRIKHSR